MPPIEHSRHGALAVATVAGEGSWLLPILRRLPGILEQSGTPLAGGRGGTYRVEEGPRPIVIRTCRRGGLPGRFIRDVYAGTEPRVWRELAVTVGLHERGVPVAPPLAAAAKWLIPGFYRAWFVSEFVANHGTLWDWLSSKPDLHARDRVLRAAGRAIAAMHAAGVHHIDLNLNNLLVRSPEEGTVALIDFDRAQSGRGGPFDWATVESRLRRSMARLDPQREYTGDADLARMAAGYRGHHA